MDMGMYISAAIGSDGKIVKVRMAMGMGFVQGTVRE
jgi:hypothetical protein